MSENNIDSHVTTPESEQGDNSQNAPANAGAIRKSTTQSLLTALSQASGQQFESVEAALAYVARTSSQNLGGNEQPTVEQSNNKGRMGRPRSADNDLREQFTKLQADLQKKDTALRQKELDTEILRHMSDNFDPDLTDYAMQKIKSNIQFIQDGSFKIVNAKGQERYAMDGNPLSLQGLIKEVAQGNPKLLKQSNVSSGSGMRAGQGNFAGAPSDDMPNYATNPAEFNAWAAKNGFGKGVGLKGAKVSATVTNASRKVL
jgi:hypothetical protein